jgi:uncharacterized protein (TIGR02118 family)
MIKRMTVIIRKRGLKREEFAKHWLGVHSNMARKMPGLKRYIINIVKDAEGTEPNYDGIVELWFDDVQAMKRAFSSEAGKATLADEVNFIGKKIVSVVEEHIII